jgi:hypothetical protein
MDLPFAVPDPPQPIQAATVRQNSSAAPSGRVNASSQSQSPQILLPQKNGGLLYNNLIPGHYRYGARPPAPPPGPLSVESSQQRGSLLGEQPQNTNSYSNVKNFQSHRSPLNREVLQVSEPEEEDDDDLLVVDLDEDDDDDGRLYKPFRHSTSNGSLHTKSNRSTQSKNSKSKAKKVQSIETKPIDLLAVLLGESSASNSPNNPNSEISNLIEDATTKSRKARSMTTALATKKNMSTQTEKKAGNDLYVDTANAHTEAALAFQRVYRSLLGLDDNNTLFYTAPDGLSPCEELAKSMLILTNEHVRMAASLKDMGIKWNMGKVELFGTVKSNSNLTSTKSGAAGNEAQSTSNNEKKPMAKHERIRLAVRGALDTANHEADITNSTFLARSTFLNAKPAAKATHPNGVGGRNGNEQALGENPIDDLMKLEKELKGMDMTLEVGASVSNLGATFSNRPDGSFCVVPPGSNYMSSSFMWSSGIMGKVGNQQQNRHNDRVGLKSPTGTSAVRPARTNHLQHFLGGNRPPTNPHPPAAAVSETPMQGNPKQDHPASNGGLSESWWGGGQGSMMASVALTTVTASHQKGSGHPTTRASSPRAESANTKQLMQLMDSLKRLGDENAQLMREVEEAKAARSEALAAKNMMEKFKKEYSQRFLKVKEALERYPRNTPDNPVSNSNYMKSASMAELQKRDQMIKTLAADLRREREDSKKKDVALRKYEGFYKEVKARSAEKAKQRKMQEAQQKVQPQNQG